MAKVTLDVIVSCFNFAGAIVLCADALRVRSTLKQQRGAERLLEVLTKHKREQLIEDTEGIPLDSKRAIQDWFARRSLRLAWVGFSLMLLGVGLDLYTKLFGYHR